MRNQLSLAFLSIILCVTFSANAQNTSTPPTDFSKYKETGIIHIESGQTLSKFFAVGTYKKLLNDVAYTYYMENLEKIQNKHAQVQFPEGSELLLVKSNEDGSDSENLLLMMSKNAKAENVRGWLWQGWKIPSNKLIVSNQVKSCASCHYNYHTGSDLTFFGKESIEGSFNSMQ